MIYLLILIILTIVFFKIITDYKKTTYYKITKYSYASMRFDKGKYGEYLIFKYLKNFEEKGARFLFNAFLPKENGKTTEIDVLMICSMGIFVFESKNYGGWIFGSETQKNWYQTFPKGRGKSHKEIFYNPIMQNESHIKALNNFFGEQLPTKSIITFSERCTLKSIQLKSDDVKVIKRDKVYKVISDIFSQTKNELLTEIQINDIYNKLYPCTQVDDSTKVQHILDIKDNYKK